MEIKNWKSVKKLFSRQVQDFGSYMNKKYLFANNDLKAASNREAIKIILKNHVQEI